MNEPWQALLVGGPNGIAARITGSIPRKLSQREIRRFNDVLKRGYTIEVLTASQEAWGAMKPGLLKQLGYCV